MAPSGRADPAGSTRPCTSTRPRSPVVCRRVPPTRPSSRCSKPDTVSVTGCCDLHRSPSPILHRGGNGIRDKEIRERRTTGWLVGDWFGEGLHAILEVSRSGCRRGGDQEGPPQALRAKNTPTKEPRGPERRVSAVQGHHRGPPGPVRPEAEAGIRRDPADDPRQGTLHRGRAGWRRTVRWLRGCVLPDVGGGGGNVRFSTGGGGGAQPNPRTCSAASSAGRAATPAAVEAIRRFRWVWSAPRPAAGSRHRGQDHALSFQGCGLGL